MPRGYGGNGDGIPPAPTIHYLPTREIDDHYLTRPARREFDLAPTVVWYTAIEGRDVRGKYRLRNTRPLPLFFSHDINNDDVNNDFITIRLFMRVVYF